MTDLTSTVLLLSWSKISKALSILLLISAMAGSSGAATTGSVRFGSVIFSCNVIQYYRCHSNKYLFSGAEEVPREKET